MKWSSATFVADLETVEFGDPSRASSPTASTRRRESASGCAAAEGRFANTCSYQ